MIYVFDCDGVILDSNSMKVEAMTTAVASAGFSAKEAALCTQFFRENFGVSRYTQIEHFMNDILDISEESKPEFTERILNHYSQAVHVGYQDVNICDGFLDFIDTKDESECYVVSGSDEDELIDLFGKIGLIHKFSKVLGSPSSKSENFLKVKALCGQDKNFKYFGDSLADVEAAVIAGFSFVGLSSYSNVSELLIQACIAGNHVCAKTFDGLQ